MMLVSFVVLEAGTKYFLNSASNRFLCIYSSGFPSSSIESNSMARFGNSLPIISAVSLARTMVDAVMFVPVGNSGMLCTLAPVFLACCRPHGVSVWLSSSSHFL